MTADGPSTPHGWKLLLLPGACAFAVLIVLVSLGNWQLRREIWKDAVLAKIETRINAEPVSPAEAMAFLKKYGDVDYLPVRLAGRFLHDRENRLLTSGQSGAGWHVYTPFETDDGQIALINRGYVPDTLKDPSGRIAGLIEGRVVVVGLARPAPAAKPNNYIPDNDSSANVFYWRDLAAMAARSGIVGRDTVLPFFIDANAAAVPGVWPKGGVTRIVSSNNHRLYSMVWYGLAVVLIGVFTAFSRSRLRLRHAAN